MTENKKLFPAYLILVIVVFFVGAKVGQNSKTPLVVNSEGREISVPADVNKIEEVWKIISGKYVDSVKNEDLNKGIMRGLVSGLNDPYSAYADRTETNQFEEDISGSFTGIGVEIGRKKDLVTVIAPLHDSPAEKAGIKAQDVIYKIGGEEIAQDSSLTEIASKIRGPAGTKVVLNILRNSQEDLEFSVERQKIQISSVNTKIDNGVGIIQITVFNEDTAEQFRKAVNEVLAANVKGIVLDLRNNPGGILETSVQIAGYFTNRNDVIVKEVSARGSRDIVHRSEGPSSLEKLPLVVLVNGGSASASEILAGALRDLRNVKLVGEKTFGKGTVQELIDLSDGSSLRITIAKWLTPKGSEIAEKGLTPDIASEDPNPEDNVDVQLDESISMVRTQIGQN